MVKQQRSERVVYFAKKASCEVPLPACESSHQEWGCFLRKDKEDLTAMLRQHRPYNVPLITVLRTFRVSCLDAGGLEMGGLTCGV